MHWKHAVLEFIPVESEETDLVTFFVGEENKAKSFFLHRTWLELSSVRFKDLLSQNENSYKLPDIRPNTFQEIVKHIYTFSDWEFNGNLVDACFLLKASMDYDLEELTHIIHETISKISLEEVGFTSNTACFVYDVIRKTSHLDRGKLKNAVLRYICKNAKLILTLDSFLNLSLEGLLEILDDDKFQVDTELDVFKAAVRWGMNTLSKNLKSFSPQNLQNVLRRPFQCVRFSNLSKFECEYYVQQMGFDPAKQERYLRETTDNEEDDPENISPLFLLAEISYMNHCGSSEVPPEKPRDFAHSQSVRDVSDKLEPTVEEILRAELYVSNFKYQVEISMWKSTLLEFKDSSHQEVQNMESEFAVLRKELSDLRKVVRKTAEDSEKKGAFNSEWRSFLRDSRNLRLRFNQSILVVLQNNTDSSLDKPTVVGILGEPGVPPPIDPGRRGQFSFGKQDSSQSIIMFSYCLNWLHTIVVGVKLNSKDEFAVGYDCNTGLDLKDTSSTSKLYNKLHSNFWEDHVNKSDENKSMKGLVGTKRFKPFLSFETTIRASMTDGVLKILIFQDKSN